MALTRLLLLLAPVRDLAQSPVPFWGCGLLGKDIQPSDPVWKALIMDLQKTSQFKKVATWNWDVQSHSDEHLSSDFLFFPNEQCAGTSSGGGSAYLDQDTVLPSGATIATLALGGNEPDQVGYCQNYTHSSTSGMPCDGFKMREGQCTGALECYCQWDPKAGICRYDVTGCGMWATGTTNVNCTGDPFPFWCFGNGQKDCSPGQDPSQCCSKPCHAGMLTAFSQFYVEMAYKGYSYASTPIVASDLTFTHQLLEEAGCGTDTVKALTGQERLKRGCPTHSAFHFYSTGCPTDPESSVQGFRDKVSTAKILNTKYALEGTIVNELGSLTGTDTQCTDDLIAAMMGKLFEHLKSESGMGVVSQMVWFNEEQTGGTFDLRLIKDGKLSKLGAAYKTACTSWAQQNGVGVAEDAAVEKLVV